MKSLYTPSRFNEFRRQPIEQLRMGRPLTQVAEIACGRYDSAAKMMSPNSIYKDPRDKWVIAVG